MNFTHIFFEFIACILIAAVFMCLFEGAISLFLILRREANQFSGFYCSVADGGLVWQSHWGGKTHS